MGSSADLSRYTPEFLHRLLRDMMLVRRFEEKAAQMYGLRKIGGFLHLYIGQEAVAAGSIAALDLKKDYVLTAYRDHGHGLLCGIEATAGMAELYGKVTGCSRGKGGSMHFFDAANHMYGGNGIVGAHIPIAAGVALKIKYRKEDGVVLCFFGDGAIHQGSFHETLNLAKIWELPVLYLCENNQYGMGTDYRRVSAVEDFSTLAASYDMPGRQVDGMDAITVYETIAAAVARIRESSSPEFMEIRTYRYRGHSMSDPGTYRTKEELTSYKEQDPIVILKQRLLEAGILDEAAYGELDKECKRIAQESAQFAEASEEPPLSDLYEDVYA
jgi:pyruvate dehydrogenase E1 component alpha subunit